MAQRRSLLSPQTDLDDAIAAVVNEECTDAEFVEWAAEKAVFSRRQLRELLPLLISKRVTLADYERIKAAWRTPRPEILAAMAAPRPVDDGFGLPPEFAPQPCQKPTNALETDDEMNGCLAPLLIIAAILAFLVWSSRGVKPVPSDDPYYDAPTGQTRGGDSY